MDLCGHATLAAAHFLFSSGMVRGGVVEFLSRSGVLSAKRIDKATGLDGDGASNGVGKGGLWIELDFPAISVNDCKSEDDLSIPKTLNGEAIVDMKMAAGCSDLIVIHCHTLLYVCLSSPLVEIIFRSSFCFLESDYL